MKKFTSILLLLISCFSLAQEKWTTQSGSVSFEASVPLFEEVRAINNSVKCVLNSEDKTIVCVLKIKDFHFKRELMETHFNEIYMESDTYPKAIFKGTFTNLDLTKIPSEGITLPINGNIKIHGVTQSISLKGKFKKIDNTIQITADFELDTDDFKIKIPSIILPKISKKVKTHIDLILE
ncbi:YceI family protein [Flavobacterium sp.]|uniref:YceI family protein n=1 Tax=Flavobacterium sp. TaxID=239 RepID=UPI002600BF9E|nr:YceI family protein [Flavobacterium sp.]